MRQAEPGNATHTPRGGRNGGTLPKPGSSGGAGHEGPHSASPGSHSTLLLLQGQGCSLAQLWPLTKAARPGLFLGSK